MANSRFALIIAKDEESMAPLRQACLQYIYWEIGQMIRADHKWAGTRPIPGLASSGMCQGTEDYDRGSVKMCRAVKIRGQERFFKRSSMFRTISIIAIHLAPNRANEPKVLWHRVEKGETTILNKFLGAGASPSALHSYGPHSRENLARPYVRRIDIFE